MTLEIHPISSEHLDSVLAVYEREFETLPTGTLNPMSSETAAALMSSPDRVHLGVFSESRFVGYLLCEVYSWFGAPEPFALSPWLSQGERVGEAVGMLVYREFKGHSLGTRLLRARRAALAEIGVRHATGMMLVDNYSSIVSYLRTGAILCGFDTDYYDLLNFVHYSGDLADRPAGSDQIETSEIDKMRELFGLGYVCRGLTWDRSGGKPTPVFTLSSEFVA